MHTSIGQSRCWRPGIEAKSAVIVAGGDSLEQEKKKNLRVLRGEPAVGGSLRACKQLKSSQ